MPEMKEAALSGTYGGLIRDLLSKRGIEGEEAVASFIEPSYERDVYDPFLMEGMHEATDRILKAIEGNEKIAVYSDFDCDGIPGAAVLHDFFKKIGFTNLDIYIPHRDREGYGFHVEAIEKLATKDVKLIITVDVGITAVDQVNFAHEKGVDVIVTDHHELPSELPRALAVLNPKCGEYPFRDLCGAGVAYKLVQALLKKGKDKGIIGTTEVPEGWEKWLLDLVAIATVADMVPLVGENRALAYWGLIVLRKTPRKGLRALFAGQRTRQDSFTEDDVAFSLAPRINAASRMDEPEKAFRLLVTEDAKEAELLARYLEELNMSRKGIVASIVKEAKKRVRDRFEKDRKVIVLGDPHWKPALLGLAANSVMEERGGMVCIWGRDANGNLKGSCRSDGSLSVVEVFQGAKDSLKEFGGHRASGGFSVTNEQVHTLPDALESSAQQIGVEKTEKKETNEDARIELSEVSGNLLRALSLLAPFGIGNPKPVFRICSTTVSSVRIFGKANDHTEVVLKSQDSRDVRAFEFFSKPEDFSLPPSEGTVADVLGKIEADSFKGNGAVVLRIVDVLSPTT